MTVKLLLWFICNTEDQKSKLSFTLSAEQHVYGKKLLLPDIVEKYSVCRGKNVQEPLSSIDVEPDPS